ncbi:uncharacterized protein PHACADRAFT_257621 [Phanerochaete carnosa HHB-10118-sp]|uniref:Uncharacterized protein n=1 Tax=Phanerochaete carnosa (strain HHB-10118-sp) TaxID=650164 RepID=K5WUA5_PHACS|nr:uncharacterized protein PHACADRAFT_257621 [Phanerochaete carnosa HHB-10118-sp]EKM54032.1 hypothetical protein PHACADRAFT_257621 [Phanerochaete carnosa HHB-10118-sp]
MCFGDNNAKHVVEYCNDQFLSLWSIADRCWRKHVEDNGPFKPEERQHRYSLALVVWHLGRYRAASFERTDDSKDDLMFEALFAKPVLVSLCNHEMLLEITVAEGHYNLDHGRANETANANHSRKRDIPKNTTFTYRVPFKIDVVAGYTASIGGGEHKIRMLVFDYKSAKLIRTSIREPDGTHQPAPPVEGQQSLEFYLEQYLEFLQSAGHHVLFSLPNFENDKGDVPTTINYSWIADVALRQLVQLDEIHGVSLRKINDYLSTVWLKAAMLVSIQTDALSDRSGTSFAEYRGTWRYMDQAYSYYITFGTPRVTAWCNDEVIMTFVVDEVFLYNGSKWEGQPVKSFSEWEIAVIMNFSYEKPPEHDGNVIRCKVDIASSHLLEAFSFFGDVDFDSEDGTVLTWVDYIISFISDEYLNIIENAGYNIIYEHDLRWRSITGYGEDGDINIDESAVWYAGRDGAEGGGMHTRTTAWRRIIQEGDMCGYDQITALSETAVNRYMASVMTSWQFEDKFKVTFKAPVVRLRNDGTAILVINLKDGFLQPMSSYQSEASTENFSYQNWRIAFQVSVKMVDHASLVQDLADWEAIFRESPAYKESMSAKPPNLREVSESDVDFKHIILDFSQMQFRHEFSSFDQLFTSHTKRAIEKVQAAVSYLRYYCLSEFVASGKHVLFSIPVWRSLANAPLYGLTSIVFQISSRRTITESVRTEQSSPSQPAIIILGMCLGRPMPAHTFRYSTDWVAHAGRYLSYGTVGISSGLFLQEKLLYSLASVNALTTIVPSFTVAESGEWRFKVASWASSEDRRGAVCSFGEVQGVNGGDFLEYLWERSDVWNYTYKHRGANYTTSGTFSVSARTENRLEIPTVYKIGSMDIKMYGKVTLELSSTESTERSWSAAAESNWQAILSVRTEEGGSLKINVESSQAQTKAVKAEEHGGALVYLKPETYLTEVMPTKIELDKAVAEFSYFTSSWESCYPGMSSYTLTQPVFNRSGDLLFELRPPASDAQSQAHGAGGPATPVLKNIKNLKAFARNGRAPGRGRNGSAENGGSSRDTSRARY